MISIQTSDGSVREISSESAKNGQVADVRDESTGSQSNISACEPKKQKAPQSAHDNAKYAAARRSAERDRDEQIARLKAETEREIERRVQKALASRAEDSDTSKEDKDGASAQHTPLITASPLDSAADDGERARIRQIGEKLIDERTKLALDGELEKVKGHFPEIKNILDIVKLERYPEIKRMVERGYALSDAMRLTYEDVYVKRRSLAAATEARGALSTTHMKPTSPRAAASHDVSEAQIRTYLESVPGATREQAIRAYKKYKIASR